MFALVATSVDRIRVLTSLAGAWLVASAFVVPATLPMRWSTGLVGVAVLALSLVSKAGRFGPPLPASRSGQHVSR